LFELRKRLKARSHARLTANILAASIIIGRIPLVALATVGTNDVEAGATGWAFVGTGGAFVDILASSTTVSHVTGATASALVRSNFVRASNALTANILVAAFCIQ